MEPTEDLPPSLPIQLLPKTHCLFGAVKCGEFCVRAIDNAVFRRIPQVVVDGHSVNAVEQFTGRLMYLDLPTPVRRAKFQLVEIA